jgi:hypothetical protein
MAANSRAASDPLTALLIQLSRYPDALIRDWLNRLLTRGEFASSAEQPASERKEGVR